MAASAHGSDSKTTIHFVMRRTPECADVSAAGGDCNDGRLWSLDRVAGAVLRTLRVWRKSCPTGDRVMRRAALAGSVLLAACGSAWAEGAGPYRPITDPGRSV